MIVKIHGQSVIFCLSVYSVIIVLIFYYNFPQYYSNKRNNYYNRIISKKLLNNTKYILTYNAMWMSIEHCMKYFKNCPVNNCKITNNTDLLPIEEFDAIIFHEPTMRINRRIPEKRKSFQKYIYISKESPITYPIIHSKNFYNWTMTYRRDSDIFNPFGRIELQENSFDVNLEKLSKKTKLVAWVVSNCRTNGTKYRIEYVKEMQKYIQVDVYGKCGNLTCPGIMSQECYEILDKNYKFYLSFENSLCKDYITEKTYKVLKFTDMVPVVLGYADYKSLVPPKSVINAEDFESPKDLAYYLLELSKHMDEYKTYFYWKKHFSVQTDTLAHLCCELCRKLNEPIRHMWYENLNEWSLGKNNSLCHKKHFV